MVTLDMLRTHEGKWVFSEKKYPSCNCPQSNQMPSIDQLAEIDPDVQGEDPKFFYSDPAQLEKLLDPDPAPTEIRNEKKIFIH